MSPQVLVVRLVCCGVSGRVNDDDGGSLWLGFTLSCGEASAGLYYTMRVMSFFEEPCYCSLWDYGFRGRYWGGFVCFHCSGVGCEAGKLLNDVVWTVLPMVSSTECSEIWWPKTNCCSYAGYAGGGDGPVWWAAFTGDG
ncbi:hypothetical protein Nepgr_022786 [Nepenthes gracilis]|uniref:Uncharacterized protein n=1 Tax=Nepenthes gracilis TaxID=150966 RepID=A0AAD3T1M8_NEPGR|nr:hypothetical protein Nepgr_022786 [Nepenthes gracilis]